MGFMLFFSFVGAYVYEDSSGADFSLKPEEDFEVVQLVEIDEDFNFSNAYEDDFDFSAEYVAGGGGHLLDGVWKVNEEERRIFLLVGVTDTVEELNGIYFIDDNNGEIVAYHNFIEWDGERKLTSPLPWFMYFSIGKWALTEKDGKFAIKVIFDIYLWPDNEEGPIYVESGTKKMPKIDNWYCGDTHYHSWYTNTEWLGGLAGELGAPIGLTKMVGRYYDFDWFMVTDHSNSFGRHNDDSWNWSAFKEGCNRFSSCLIGEEVNCRTPESGNWLGNSLPGNHFLAYNISEGVLDNGQEDVSYCDEIVDGVYEQGGFGYVAHPEGEMDFFIADIVMKWYDYSLGFSGLQVWNGDINDEEDGARITEELEDGLERWRDILLGRGGLVPRKVYVSAGSDAHGDFQNYGKEYTCCYADGYSKEGVFDSLRNGACYMGNNGVLTFEIDNLNGGVAKMGEEVEISGEARVDLTVFLKEYCELSFYRGIIGEDEESELFSVIVEASGSPEMDSFDLFEFDPIIDSRRYYRLECVSADGSERIYTNPIWVDPGNLCVVGSPDDGDLVSGEDVLFEVFGTGLLDSIEYIDYSDLKPKWKRLCKNCERYIGSEVFGGGMHDVVVKCSDSSGEEGYGMSFFVDSSPTEILGVEPSGGFSNGGFSIRFLEDSPVGVFLYYGGEVEEIELASCVVDGELWECGVQVDLSGMNGDIIDYWFVVEADSGLSVESVRSSVVVDVVDPFISNKFFWEWGTGKRSNYIDFYIVIDEDNFDEVVVSYDSSGKAREAVLCDELVGGVCVGSFRFRKNYSNVKVVVRDLAGNSFSGIVFL
jgi:hypothetical protein